MPVGESTSAATPQRQSPRGAAGQDEDAPGSAQPAFTLRDWSARTDTEALATMRGAAADTQYAQ